MTLTLIGTRAVAAAEDILESESGSFASGENEKEDDGSSECKKLKKSIAEWIVRPLKPPSYDKDEEDEEKEEDVGAPLDST